MVLFIGLCSVACAPISARENSFHSLNTAKIGGGCPLSSLWTDFSGYPSNTNALSNNSNRTDGFDLSRLTYSDPSSCNSKEYDQIVDFLLQLYENGGIEAPKANRLAFHSSATYSAASHGLGGPDGGWLMFQQNKNFPEMAGLEETIDILVNVTKVYDCITFSDVVYLAAAVLTEAAGGPAIAWMPGRRDASIAPVGPPLAARLPDASFTIAAVNYFYTNLGLTERELVALNGGGHSFGASDVTASGWNGSFTPAGDVWPTPKNLYFIQSFDYIWKPEIVSSQKGQRLQYVLAENQDTKITTEDGIPVIRLPSDVAFLTAEGDLKAWSCTYAVDEQTFLEDFAYVMQRISQLGANERNWKLLDTYEWLGINGTGTNYGKNMSPIGSNPPLNKPPAYCTFTVDGSNLTP